MKVRVKMWENSLAVRIPKSLAAKACLQKDTLVYLTLVDGKLIISPISEPRITLDDLLAGITPDNNYEEDEAWVESFEAMADDPEASDVEYARYAQAEVMLANPV